RRFPWSNSPVIRDMSFVQTVRIHTRASRFLREGDGSGVAAELSRSSATSWARDMRDTVRLFFSWVAVDGFNDIVSTFRSNRKASRLLPAPLRSWPLRPCNTGDVGHPVPPWAGSH